MIEVERILDIEQYLYGIDTVLFDLDDTLYSEKDYVKSGYCAIAKLFPEIENMEKKLWTVFEKGGKAIDKVLQDEGLRDLNNKQTALHAYRLHTPKIHLYEGVSEMLMRIRASHKTGIITDGRPEGQLAKIKALGLEEMVDEIIITDTLGGIEYRKPCSKAFTIMQNRMRTPYERMVYVGDNISKDFIALQKLGMRSIWVINKNGLYFES